MITASLFNSIKSKLDEYYAKLGMTWKEKESQGDFYQATPEIYLFTCPKTERDPDGWPRKSPAITVVLDGWSMQGNDDVELDVSFHCCVVNSSVIDREKTTKDGGYIHFLTTDGYTDSGVDCNLYKDCLTLGEITANAVNFLDGVVCRVNDIKLDPPDPNTPDFPFCTCTVRARLGMLQTRRGAPLYESWYGLL